ncbi:MAG: hypothetical protein HZT40_02460 [Candidatus Thiothrix singaporensis]|uniref:Uncharacterized protein n=1 Tax=Candidatus Thiothrix singaporensis TaxID=2799669 RepID=A0A7L6ANI6_9GAMM|nr:MAG: hypothetical protein HZT40_02460 [Candidatus Thiothrix singaporensis]
MTAWQLLAGSSAGGSNYQDSGQLASTVTSRTVSGLPTDGSTVYVRLRYQIGGVWSYQTTPTRPPARRRFRP